MPGGEIPGGVCACASWAPGTGTGVAEIGLTSGTLGPLAAATEPIGGCELIGGVGIDGVVGPDWVGFSCGTPWAGGVCPLRSRLAISLRCCTVSAIAPPVTELIPFTLGTCRIACSLPP